jgi:hypothetical protein
MIASPMGTPKIRQGNRRTVLDGMCLAILIAYFLHFALPALRGGFREDEMMNMGICWRAGPLKSLLANVMFWKVFDVPGGALYNLPLYLYRPGGAFYYLPLYHFFKLDPLAYRVVQVSILAASIPLVYYLSRRLASSRSVAFFAVLLLCYHPRLTGLIFVGAFIYDVLCGLFYFAALAYYIHVRETRGSLRPLQLFGFLGLYICALNCKEMAVTLPVMVLIYEVLESTRWTDWNAFLRWARAYAAPSLIAGTLTALYIYGKTHGSGSLASLDPYQPRYSWHDFMVSNTSFVGELLFTGHAITPLTVLGLWLGVFAYAFTRRNRLLQLMAFWIVIVPLPLAFIVPVRGDAPLYLLLFGWAMIVATIVFDLISLISKLCLAVSNRIAAARGATSADASTKVSLQIVRITALLLVAFGIATFTQRENQRLQMPWRNVGTKTAHVIQAFQSLNLRPLHGSRVLLLLKDNVFHNKWNVFFIASLIWNDHSLRIWVENPTELTPEQQANADYILSISEVDAEVVRSPDVPKPD